MLLKLAHHIARMVTYNIYCFFRNSTVCCQGKFQKNSSATFISEESPE